MAKRADASGPLALPRRPRDPARTLSRTRVGSSAFGATSIFPRRPAAPAEIAQARAFERLLQAECADLQDLAHRMATGKYQQLEPNDSRPAELAQIRARIDEIDGLLRALRGRFPQHLPDGDR